MSTANRCGCDNRRPIRVPACVVKLEQVPTSSPESRRHRSPWSPFSSGPVATSSAARCCRVGREKAAREARPQQVSLPRLMLCLTQASRGSWSTPPPHARGSDSARRLGPGLTLVSSPFVVALQTPRSSIAHRRCQLRSASPGSPMTMNAMLFESSPPRPGQSAELARRCKTLLQNYKSPDHRYVELDEARSTCACPLSKAQREVLPSWSLAGHVRRPAGQETGTEREDAHNMEGERAVAARAPPTQVATHQQRPEPRDDTAKLKGEEKEGRRAGGGDERDCCRTDVEAPPSAGGASTPMQGAGRSPEQRAAGISRLHFSLWGFIVSAEELRGGGGGAAAAAASLLQGFLCKFVVVVVVVVVVLGSSMRYPAAAAAQRLWPPKPLSV